MYCALRDVILVRKTKGNFPVWGRRNRWKDTIKTEVKDIRLWGRELGTRTVR